MSAVQYLIWGLAVRMMNEIIISSHQTFLITSRHGLYFLHSVMLLDYLASR